MQNIVRNLRLPEGNFDVEVVMYDETDKNTLREIYNNWIGLSNELESAGGRRVNLPEALSEGCFCISMDAVRVISRIPGANSSWDCYNLSTNRRIQVKACSVIPDLSSFGPNSEWDEFYFMDFYRNGQMDGTYDIYRIENDDIYNYEVNANQTFLDQQREGRRPRFSIYRGIISAQNLNPIITGNLSN